MEGLVPVVMVPAAAIEVSGGAGHHDLLVAVGVIAVRIVIPHYRITPYIDGMVQSLHYVVGVCGDVFCIRLRDIVGIVLGLVLLVVVSQFCIRLSA